MPTRERRVQGGSGRVAEGVHEPSHLRLRRVVVLGVALAAVVSAFTLMLWIVFVHEQRGSALRQPPEPQVEVAGARNLELLREKETRRLDTYGWVNRNERVFHIPIQAAMDRVIRRGLPARQTTRPSD